MAAADCIFEEDNLKFHQYANRLLRFRSINQEQERIDINVILDHLNPLHLKTDSINKDLFNKAIQHCCEIVSPASGQLAVKTCNLVTNLITKTEVPLKDEAYTKAIDFVCHCIDHSDAWAKPDILRAAGAIFYGTGGRIPLQRMESLLCEDGQLPTLIFSPSSESLTRKAALQCVENIAMRCSPYIDVYYASRCLAIFMGVLKTKMVKVDELLQCRLLISALRGIHHVVSCTRGAHGMVLGEVLAALKAYNFYGRDNPLLSIPSCLLPIHTGNDLPKSVVHHDVPVAPIHRKQIKKKIKTKDKRNRDDLHIDRDDGENKGATADEVHSLALNPWAGLGGSASESEYSDSETGSANKLSSFQAKVRHSSLASLFSVAKATDKRIIFGYWSAFLPSSIEDNPGTLIDIIQNDSHAKTRVAALAALAAIMDGSKMSVLVAAERESSARLPFTPFSVVVGNIIKEVHRCLLHQLGVENTNIGITQIIKCLSAVIANSPYQKLKAGLITQVVRIVRPYLQHKDPNIRVAAFTCMGAVITVHAPLLEVSLALVSQKQEDGVPNTLMSADGPSALSGHATPPVYAPSSETRCFTPTKALASGQPKQEPESWRPAESQAADSQATGSCLSSDLPWLIRLCAKNICCPADSVIPLPIRLEALQVLAALSSGYLSVILPCMENYTLLVVEAFRDSDPSVQLHGAKTSESAALALSKFFAEEKPDQAYPVSLACAFWQELLRGPLTEALQLPERDQLRATCCDCLSNIGPNIFQRLPRDQQIMCQTLLLGLSVDSSALVRGSASRALGFYILFPCLREDVNFVADVANAVITSLEDENVAVRLKASWSMANMTDALVLNLNLPDFSSFAAELSDMLFIRMFSAASTACLDSDKMKYNGVRSLGNLLRYMQPHTLEKKNMQPVIESAVKTLIQSLSQNTMKVRWNACYALGNALQNDYVTTGREPWLDQLHTSLCLAMKNSKNFKVRINAAVALTSARTREKYGAPEVFASVWKYVVAAMEEATVTEDFAEYKYIDTLGRQLCNLVLHLTKLTHAEDLPCIGAMLFSREETLKRFLTSSKISTDDLTEVTKHMQSLLQQDLSPEQRTVIRTLCAIVTPHVTEEIPKSTFKQIYD